MPSPIAHLGVGYAIYRHYEDRLPQGHEGFGDFPSNFQLVVVADLSMLPDLNVIPAIIFRDMESYHHNFSHSLIFAIPVALLVAGIFHRVYRSGLWRWFSICLLSYDLHVILDGLTSERGVMLFWPLTQTRFASPIKLFYDLQWGLGWFSIHHFGTVLTESLFSLLVILAVIYFNRRRAQQTAILPQKNH